MDMLGILFLLCLGIIVSCSYSSSSEPPKEQQVSGVQLDASHLTRSHIPSGRHAFLQRELLKNTSVTCNDGTTAGFYLRRSPSSSKKWLVFLEGGWHCYSQVSCQQRWIRARPLMTSAHWPQMRSS